LANRDSTPGGLNLASGQIRPIPREIRLLTL